MAELGQGDEEGSCTNRVVFFEDPEVGISHNNNSNSDSNTTSKEGMMNSGSNQTNKISIVGLPGDAQRSRHSSDQSVNSSIVNGASGDKIAGTSILKKRKAVRRNSGNTQSTLGNNSGFTGGFSLRSRSSHSTGGSSASTYSPHAKATPRPIWYGRWLFFTLLCLVAIALGYLTYHHLSDNETRLADCVFEKVAENAIKVISGNQKKKKLGMDTLASVIGSTGHDYSQWPYVAQSDFEAIASDVIDVSRGCNIGFAPILTPTQVPPFEFFAAEWYQNDRVPEPFPNGTGIKVNDQVGVWAMKDGAPFHDVSGETEWDSERRIVVPMFHHVNGASKKLMFNLHSSPLLGGMIENMMTCAEETKELILEHELQYSSSLLPQDGDEEAEEPPPVPSLKDCTMVTDIAHNKTSWRQGAPMGPGANMLQPIFPGGNTTEMVGVLVTAIVWSENMIDVFAANIDGVYIVISTPTEQVSYQVIKGIVEFIGIGDHHDPRFDYAKKEGDITIPGLFAPQSVPYTISLYPSDTVYEMYRTKNPKFATVGAVCVMFFTVLMFLAYDFLVRREFSAKAELLKAKRHFMRYVSHEVRTPLNSVCMGLNLMQEEIQSKLGSTEHDGSKNASITIEEATSWLNLSRDVHISAQSATNVLNDFLNYDKIESRQLSLELSVIPIQALISEISKEFVLPAHDKAIHLSLLQEKVKAAETTPVTNSRVSKVKNSIMKAEVDHIDQIQSQLLEDQVVVGDRARLSQVVRNVISNAIKFTPIKGSITVKTTWMVATVGESTSINLQDGRVEDLYQTGWIQLEVTDTGPGMTEEQLATVFESGVQFNANKNQKGGGSGLGLFIAKGIVDQHNGTLTVDSEGLGKGSSFLCKLPLFCKPKEPLIENIPVAPRDETITERVTSSWLDTQNENDLCYRILVVDDAPMNRKLLTRLLMKRGHHVDMAEDGLEAYERVKEQMKEGKRYDTILMDFQMPVMDGPTATQQIRMEGCDSFIVGITGNVLPQDVEHFKICGADGVLGKPFQVEELESMWIEYGVTSG
mmetsp:Transcript_30629/g.72249  ORF Transcript_30629/g.72249 Transcript_30629/m.72249 type:complete len:1037 (+) Transcript_30629:232-3342(+)